MPGRSGAGTNFSTFEGWNDPLSTTPNTFDTWGALFREGANQTLGRSAIDQLFVQTGQGGGTSIPTEEANQRYGLNLKPTGSGRITTDMAEYLQRKQAQSVVDQAIIQNAQPDMLTSLGVGVAASLTDPAEFAINAFLPMVGIAKYGQAAWRAGRILRPAVASRWMARSATKSALKNPFLAGAIEGAGSTVLTSPFLVDLQDKLGREYSFEDALTDVAVSGAAGSLLQGGMSLFGRGRRTNAHLNALPIDKEKAYIGASSDFANGNAIEVSKTVDKNATLEAVNQTRRDLTDEILKATDAERVYEAPKVVDPESPTITSSEGRAVAPPDDIPPRVLENPEFQRHATDLEKRLLAHTDPEAWRGIVSQHVEGFNAKLVRLADMFDLNKDDFAEVYDQAIALQDEVLSDVAQLNELLPADAQIPLDVRTTQKGIFRKDALSRLGKSINKVNSLALSDNMDDATKVTALTREFDALRAQLKAAQKNLKQAQTKGTATEAWLEKVQELTPQVHHVQTLLRALGEPVQAPELTLGDYIMGALDGNVADQLDALIRANPDLLDEPTYRVRKSIFDNVMRRLHETEQYLKSVDDLTGIRPSKFPENDSLLADIRQELSELGETLDPDVLQEKLFEQVNTDIQAKKALGIFDEAQLARFDAIEENFKNNVAKTEAVKKGALQAQICALGGIE